MSRNYSPEHITSHSGEVNANRKILDKAAGFLQITEQRLQPLLFVGGDWIVTKEQNRHQQQQCLLR